MSRTRLAWAQWLVTEHPGIKAFIVDASSKRPLGGHSWMIRNSSDPGQLAEWFDMTENCNWGAWLGKEHVVIDLDMACDTEGFSGIDIFEAICLENDIADFRTEFGTLIVKTPSGGYHLYFRTPHPCANKNTFPSHIDVRGAIGYVVGPGSKIKAGEWAVVDEDAPIMDIPDFLLEYLVSPGAKNPNRDNPLIEWDLPENIEQALAWLKDTPPAIEGENGDDHTYEVCCMLRDFGISETEALRLLNVEDDDGVSWNSRCIPPWDDGHLEIKIKNSYAFGQNRPGVKAETYQRDKLMAGRPAGGWAAQLTDERVAAMFRPKSKLAERVAQLKAERAAKRSANNG